MLNVTRQIQGSGNLYVEQASEDYYMLARRIKLGSSTFGAQDAYNFNYCNTLYDRDNNIYIVAPIYGANTPRTDGINITKYAADKHDFSSFAWSKNFLLMGDRIYPRDAAISDFGNIAVTGMEMDGGDVFVLVVDTDGNLEIFDKWSSNTTDFYGSSVFWWTNDDPRYNSPYTDRGLSLSVICHNTWYGYGGSPWSSPLMLRYGYGSDGNNYIDHRNKSNMDATLQGHVKLMGNNEANWNPLARPFRKQPAFPYEDGDGYFSMMMNYGNSGRDYKYCQSNHYPWGQNYARTGYDFSDIERPGNSSYTVGGNSAKGDVWLQDFIWANTSTYGSATYSYYKASTKNSSNITAYDTHILMKHNGSTINWVKTWTGYNSSTYWQNSGDQNREERTQNIVVPSSHKFGGTSTPNIAQSGIYVPYHKDADTVSVLHFDSDGDVINAVDFTGSSGQTPFEGYSLGQDNRGNIFLNLKTTLSVSNAYGTWRHIKLPPFDFWNVPSSQTLSVASGTVDDNITISRATLPTIQDQTDNVSTFTIGALSYGNSSGYYPRTRYDNTTNLGCNSSGDLCISNTNTTASPHRVSQEVSD